MFSVIFTTYDLHIYYMCTFLNKGTYLCLITSLMNSYGILNFECIVFFLVACLAALLCIVSVFTHACRRYSLRTEITSLTL